MKINKAEDHLNKKQNMQTVMKTNLLEGAPFYQNSNPSECSQAEKRLCNNRLVRP